MQTPISIHALHEESDPLYGANALLPAISIHALHEENEAEAGVRPGAAGGGRRVGLVLVFDVDISIHALHEESDSARSRRSCRTANFNPRSP